VIVSFPHSTHLPGELASEEEQVEDGIEVRRETEDFERRGESYRRARETVSALGFSD